MIKNFSVFLFFCFFIFVACKQERDPCLQPVEVPFRIHTIRPLTDSTFTDTLLQSAIWVAIDSQRGVRYLNKSAYFSIQLSPLADTCRYALAPDSTTTLLDTFTFYYGRRLQFLSNACGYTYFFTLTDVKATKHNLDSVKIKNPDVSSNVNTPEHVQIFF